MSSDKPTWGMVWLPVTIVLLGIIARWEVLFNALPEGTLASLFQLNLYHSKASIYTFNQLAHYFSAINLWGIWCGVFAAYLLIIWKIRLHNYLRPLVIFVLHLLVGGILSLAIDLLFFKDIQDLIQINVNGLISINLTLSGLILFIGVSYIGWAATSRNWQLRSQYKLSPNQIPNVQINSLPRGVDNVHIDVLLSRKFCKSANYCIHNLFPVVAREFLAGKRRVEISEAQFKPLYDIFAQMVEQTLRRAKENHEKEIVELLVISVFKYVHDEVDRTVNTYVRDDAGALNGFLPQIGNSESERNLVEYVAMHKDNIAATVNELILSSLSKNHLLPFHKALKGFLGIKDSYSIRLLLAPLALCGHHHSDRLLLNKYILTGLLRKDQNHFHNIDRELARIFQPCLALLDREDIHNTAELNEAFVGERMGALLQPSVFMDSTNIKKLFDQEWTQQNIDKSIKERNSRKKRKQSRHLLFQQGLFQNIVCELKKSPIAPWLVASYQVQEVLAQSGSDISPSALIHIIVKAENKNDLEERISKSASITKRLPAKDVVNSAWEVVHNDYEKFIYDNLLRILKDFSHYRRDMLIQHQLLQAYNHINLLSDERDIQTSRANYTLHDFTISTEVDSTQGPVRSHIIIKADLRGSTQVTDKLIELSLNPASHFERNFFTPVNDLIELYGAAKVFIEGDAIILILNDYEGVNSNHHIASRACGLAVNILKVVAQQNKELQCYALPELELGIGIAYSNDSPRYLFDGDHRITISPAINRADRLSACTWAIRDWRDKQSAPETHVEVYKPSKSAESIGAKAQKDMVLILMACLLKRMFLINCSKR